jgi:hypothetical protein
MEDEQECFPITKYNPYLPYVSYSTPESPGTAIARRDPYMGSEVLEKICKDQTARVANCQGYAVADSYLKKLPPSTLENLSGVTVSVKREKESRLFGLTKKERITLDIDLEF